MTCEGPSRISGPIPPDPSLFPEYYRRPASARGRLEGHGDGTMALLSGPLAPDPGLHPECYSCRDPPHPPRIGPGATHILERGQRGVVGALLKPEGVSFSPSTPKQKQCMRDYGKENVRRLREIQKRCKEQEAVRVHSQPVPVKALWSPSKYHNIPSRVMAQLQESGSSPKPQCQKFLRAHSSCVSAGPAGIHRSTSVSALRLPDSRRNAGDENQPLEIQGKSVDFIRHNARAAGKAVLRRSQSLTNLKEKPIPSAVKGQVPQYLEERKEQWRKEKEERRKNAPDPTIPAGHTLMTEKERQDTLQSLKESHQSLVKELLSLPVRADTLSICSRRTQLDRRLSEMEEAIKIFSRDKVYIKTNS
ncbi:Enkurin domain-containing protein 1 [Merluccius polli]|uniref:Enkurin domain-containing protein 1 n=1 Tax=Merluccius polli TaxID=89951 RepID=A0AA47PAT0_MERPO|nr:Enkurin domain-containing protein 1 [Merluccius polli]